MTTSDEQWWFCTRHLTVEPPDTDCPGKDLLGPYPSREEAARALEKVRERNAEWDAQDELEACGEPALRATLVA